MAIQHGVPFKVTASCFPAKYSCMCAMRSSLCKTRRSFIRCQAHVQAVCSVSCILPCQQHCCQEHYSPNISTQSPEHYLPITMCNSLWRHVPGTLLSCLIWTIVIFNKINTNTKCSAKRFCYPKATQHLHHMPQFFLVVLFTQLAPVLLHGSTKVSIPI